MSEKKDDKLGLFGLIALLVFGVVALAQIAFLAYMVWKSSQSSITPEGIERARQYIKELERAGA